jgi:hypothetical protein
MNGRPVKFSTLAPALACLAAASAVGAPAAADTAAAIAGAQTGASFPSFARVPATPKDVRSARAWKAAVVATRIDGAGIARQAAATPWTLADTADWAARERSEATPPAPVTTPAEGDTEAFVRAMRARATPPPRSR